MRNTLAESIKLIEKIYDHWFLTFIFIIATTLIVFASQAFIIPIEFLQNKFNPFICLMVIGISIYWYLISCFHGILISYSIKNNAKADNNYYGYSMNIFGLLVGTASIIISSAIIYLLTLIITYRYWFHFIAFVIAHILLYIITRKLLKFFNKQILNKQRDGF